ncbi:hypothetical protein VYU27_009240 [Nannochloropsis oceanica]
MLTLDDLHAAIESFQPDVVVVGAGVAGASVTYHLTHPPSSPSSTYAPPSLPLPRVLLLDAGKAGQGRQRDLAGEPSFLTSDVSSADSSVPHHPDGESSSSSTFPFHPSGTAVFPSSSSSSSSSSTSLPSACQTVKMIVTVYPSSSSSFIAHHGERGARTYLRFASQGVEMQKTLAKRLCMAGDREGEGTGGYGGLVEKGSMYVCSKGEEDAFWEEFQLLRRLMLPEGQREEGRDEAREEPSSSPIRWCEEEEVVAMHGSQAGFTRGIFFPQDAVIDSTSYTHALIQAAVATGRALLLEDCPAVEGVEEEGGREGGREGGVILSFNSLFEEGNTSVVKIRVPRTVIATGGFFLSPSPLAGILRPCFSYLAAVPSLPSQPPSGPSPNFFTFGFTHDWCVVASGHVRVSGEDHFSALKPPRRKARSRALVEWVRARYGGKEGGRKGRIRVADASELRAGGREGEEEEVLGNARHGVYGETPDSLPLVGSDGKRGKEGEKKGGKGGGKGRLVYCLGCNAWGQSSLTYAASLVPGLLGYRELSAEQEEAARLMSVRRFRRDR